MRIDLIVHIAAGFVAIASGFVALYVAKGAAVHRKSGMVFVYAMIVMGSMGAGIAALRNKAPEANVPAGLLAVYMVITGLVTVSRPAWWSRRWDIGVMLLVLAAAFTDLWFGIGVVVNPNPKLRWMLIPFTLFSTIEIAAIVGDVRMLRGRVLRGTTKLARHLWRMCFALFLATSSFFLGQAKVFPQSVRSSGVLAIPVLAVLVTMFYWMWRVRSRRRLRGMTGAEFPSAV